MAEESEQGSPDTEPAEAPDGAGGGSTINSQVTDAIAALDAATTGLGPSTSAAMLAVMGADSIALAMLNAVARQQADATIGSATLAAVCARLSGTRLPGGAATAASTEQFVAGAEAQAHAAIMLLKSQAERDGGEAARAALGRVAAAAAPSPAKPDKAEKAQGQHDG